MKTFRQYMTEAMNQPYKHKFVETLPSGPFAKIHQYDFKDKDGKGYNVFIRHGIEETSPEVMFQDEHGNIDTTGMVGHNAIRVFSTIKDIMKTHAKTYPVKEYRFTKTGYSHSRSRLYSTFTKMAGGEADESSFFASSYRIPVKGIR